MYTVVYTHKTINAFELLIQRVYEDLIGTDLPNPDAIKTMITSEEGQFCAFNDFLVLNSIIQKSLGSGYISELCKMITNRNVLQIAKVAEGMYTTEERKPDFFDLRSVFKTKRRLLPYRAAQEYPENRICLQFSQYRPAAPKTRLLRETMKMKLELKKRFQKLYALYKTIRRPVPLFRWILL